MLARAIVLALIGVPLTSCISTPNNHRKADSSPNLPDIKLVQKEPSTKCSYLGEVYGFRVNFRSSFAILGMKHRVDVKYSKALRSKIKSLGGNTIVKLMIQKTDERDMEFYAVYKC